MITPAAFKALLEGNVPTKGSLTIFIVVSKGGEWVAFETAHAAKVYAATSKNVIAILDRDIHYTFFEGL